MVSKLRVTIGMFVLLVLAGGTIALLISLDAGAFWIKSLPIAVMVGGAAVAQSLGLFTKSTKDKAPKE
ncbi:hypothetical protein [Amycolatopsis pittospori]|uniref:hypothetical protein n=1 Tax=Amycolatopsis pittospori TaxID=2749434 RepID=UPI0015F0337F|nr:hypothetical protein [Amycolatopsis pittospori]